jgi:hypothetical protein
VVSRQWRSMIHGWSQCDSPRHAYFFPATNASISLVRCAQGPPGTGKSRTIIGILSAAIAAGVGLTAWNNVWPSRYISPPSLPFPS